MNKADEMLQKVLKNIADEKGLPNNEGAADYLLSHPWEEIKRRINFFKEVGSFLQVSPMNTEALKKSVSRKKLEETVFNRFDIAQLNNLFNNVRSSVLIKDLLDDGKTVPDKTKIDYFIDEAVKLGFHSPENKPNRSGAALFASVLLTSVYPNYFVDFRQDRWKAFSKNFDLEKCPPGASYGEMLLWAGKIARDFSKNRTYIKYFGLDTPNWIVSGLAYLFSKEPELTEIVDMVVKGHRKESVKGDDYFQRGDNINTQAKKIWEVLQKHNPQVVLQGPPGSGKTYLAEQVIKYLSSSAEVEQYRLGNSQVKEVDPDQPVIWDIVQFHPSYSYEDFVRGLVTVPAENGIIFQAQNRILAEATNVASQNPDIPVILILDEVNRADLSRVLGELLYALERDRRGSPVSSQYAVGEPPDRTLILPENLYLIATMNTADRSIALVDYAIRRRFSFVSISPSKEVVRSFYSNHLLHGGAKETAIALSDGVAGLYDAVYSLFDAVPDAEDIRIGHSYFLVKGNRSGRPLTKQEWAEAIAFRFAYEVVPMIAEYYKERRIRDEQDFIKVNDQYISLQLGRQEEIFSKVLSLLLEDVEES